MNEVKKERKKVRKKKDYNRSTNIFFSQEDDCGDMSDEKKCPGINFTFDDHCSKKAIPFCGATKLSSQLQNSLAYWNNGSYQCDDKCDRTQMRFGKRVFLRRWLLHHQQMEV